METQGRQEVKEAVLIAVLTTIGTRLAHLTLDKMQEALETRKRKKKKKSAGKGKS